MCQKKKEEEDLPVIKIALIQRLNDFINKSGGILISAIWNNTNKTSTNQTEITWKQKGKVKQLHRYFKQQTNEISREKTRTWLKKENLQKETEFLRRAAQNKFMRTNYIKAKIERTQQNSKCRLCVDRDETINHKISEYSKLTQRGYKSRLDWVEKVIHWELCRKFKFDLANKWYIHDLESIQENETHKILGNFKIPRDHLILARRLDLIIINKKEITCWIVDFLVPAYHRVKLQKCEKRDKYFDLDRGLKKPLNMLLVLLEQSPKDWYKDWRTLE